MNQLNNTFIVFDHKTRRLFPYTDDLKLFNEEYIQQSYCKHYKSKLIFLNCSCICMITLKNILSVSWEQLDIISNLKIDKPIRISDL